jgi:hypothetical protein
LILYNQSLTINIRAWQGCVYRLKG